MKTKVSKSSKACCLCEISPLMAAPEHVDAFKALAHLGRLQVFFYLVQAAKPVPANQIQKALKLPGPTLSHHLDELEQAGLIERKRDVRFIHSSVKQETITELVRVLTACC